MNGLLNALINYTQPQRDKYAGLLTDAVTGVPDRAKKLAQGLLNAPSQLAQLASPQSYTALQNEMLAPRQAQPGKWIDAGMELSGMAPVGGLLAHTVYHGSPHKFDKFDMSKIGTGEGAQAYGHGLYFAESPEVAKSYIKENVSDLPKLDQGEKYWLRYGLPPESGKSRHVQHGFNEDGVSVMGSYDELGRFPWSQQMIFSTTAGEMGKRPLYIVAGKQRPHNPNVYGQSGFGSDGEPLIEGARVIREATPLERHRLVKDMNDVAVNHFGFSEIPDLFKILNSEDPRTLYKVDIPDEAVARFLDWDKPLSEQAPEVQAALSNAGVNILQRPNSSMVQSPTIRNIVRDALKQDSPENVGLMVDNDYGLYQRAIAAAKMKGFNIDESSPGSFIEQQAKDYIDALNAFNNQTGEKAYRSLMGNPTSMVDASSVLQKQGIPGIRYLDGGSRSAGQGTSNFVLFDDQLARIIERNGQPTGLLPWKEGEWLNLNSK